jgi:hypothetical protein
LNGKVFHKWRFIAGEIIYKWDMWKIATLNCQRAHTRREKTGVGCSWYIFSDCAKTQVKGSSKENITYMPFPSRPPRPSGLNIFIGPHSSIFIKYSLQKFHHIHISGQIISRFPAVGAAFP